MEKSSDIILNMSPDGTILFINHTAPYIGEEEVIGRSIYEYIYPEFKDEFRNLFNKVLQTGRTENFETFDTRFNNGTSWYENRLIPFKNIEQAFNLILITTDITERRQMVEALKNSEKKYRDLVDNALVGIYKTNLKGDILYVNEALSKMFDFESPEEMMRESVLARYKNLGDRNILIGNLEKTGRVNNFELEVFTKTGKTKNVLLSATLDGEVLSGMIMDITERKQMEEKLRAMSFTDELTGLYNRRGFFIMIEQQLKMAKRMRRRTLLLYIDVDNLKKINDTLGHQEGDLALIEIANILKETYRESDIIARIGGDEFAVYPAGSTEDCADIITARLGKNLELHNLKREGGYKLSISFGIACYNPENPSSIDELLAQADKLMYEQKKHKNHKNKL
jgi:diguanylate cyclase (GGDEF)-like protein/PAS domain S-box-containing protein